MEVNVRLFCIGMALLATACVTPYQSSGITGGYNDRQLAPGVYLITVHGNGYTGTGTLNEYMLRRGLELCSLEGFPHARIVDPNISTSSYQTPVTYYTTGNTTQQSGGGTIHKHVIQGKAVCMTKAEFNEWQAGLRTKLINE